MKTLHAFLGIAAIVIGSQAFGEYYENPYNHYAEYKAGDSVTWKITSTGDGVPQDDIARVAERMSERDYYGTSFAKWKYTDTTAPAIGFPSISVAYTDYADGVSIHQSEKNSDEFVIA